MNIWLTALKWLISIITLNFMGPFQFCKTVISPFNFEETQMKEKNGIPEKILLYHQSEKENITFLKQEWVESLLFSIFKNYESDYAFSQEEFETLKGSYLEALYVWQTQIHFLQPLSQSIEVLKAITLEDLYTAGETTTLEKAEFVEVPLPELDIAIQDLGKRLRDQSFQAALDAYHQIALLNWERETITKIITSLADNNIISLGFMKKSLKQKGKKINHVHPMSFIEYIFSNKKLKECMHKIYHNSFKWEGFIEGYVRRMKEESYKDNLYRFVPGFAYTLNVNPDKVKTYIDRHDWEGLVYFLLNL